MRRNRQQPVTHFRSDYATRADFCDAFAKDTNSLYLLAFLLTANHEAAERCFVAAVEQAFRLNLVFKEWVTSWIRRTLITGAITIIFDASNGAKRCADAWYSDQREAGLAIEAITRLADLDRFVFVLSVLERYSLHECSLLLGCPPGTVIESRARALGDLPALNTSLMSVANGVSHHLSATVPCNTL
jgi:DNA-directed RNA polymerase specialized sigma24 family protein